MNRLVRRGAHLVLGLLVLLLSKHMAAGENTSVRPRVIVLRPAPSAVDPWPEGMQAVVAELVAAGYELVLRASVAEDRETLLGALASAVEEEGALGALVVARDGERGIAYVCTRKEGTTRIETDVSEGAVGAGRTALRIAQLIGPPRFDVPEPRPRAPAPIPPSSASTPPVHDNGLLLALQAGLAFSSDLSEPLPVAGLVARKGIVGPLTLDASAWLTLGASRLETSAGTVDVDAEEITLHVSFDPFRESSIGVSLGLGGGIVWVQGVAAAAENYAGTNDSTRVTLLSARATAFYTHRRWSLLVAVEPGVMLPPVTIGAGNESARLGRPWTQASVGLGWNL
jgi:hypothetical protein